MQDAVTVVISAAGMGTRLGMSMPKALVEIRGKPILTRQLEMLAEVEDVVVVAGFRSQLVLDLLRAVRPNVRVALNHEFGSTGTAASVAKAAALAKDWVLALDGDLLVRPEDLHAVLTHPGPCLGVIPARSAAPVYAELDGDETVVGLSQDRPTKWEWSGLAKIEREVALSLGQQHVFTGLVDRLPMPAVPIDCAEIDDLQDLDFAERWVARVDGEVSGSSADAVDQRVVREFWARKSQEGRTRWTSEEMLDFELSYLRELAPAPDAILDLGSGHGELSRPLAEDGTRLVAVDFAAPFGGSFVQPNHVFVEASVTEYETTERFDLVLLFGVVTSLDETDELPLYGKIARWLKPDGLAVVKNQCALDEEFVTAGYSEDLGAEYSGRYPLVANQLSRLRSVFPTVESRAYPEHFNAWRNSAHFAFVCRGTPD